MRVVPTLSPANTDTSRPPTPGMSVRGSDSHALRGSRGQSPLAGAWGCPPEETLRAGGWERMRRYLADRPLVTMVALASILLAACGGESTPPTPTSGLQATVAVPATLTPSLADAPTPSAAPTAAPSPATTPESTPKPKSVDETDLQLTLRDGFRISLFTPNSLGPIRFMAFSPDGILFVSMPSATGLYSGDREGGKIFALPDLDQDGEADEAREVLTEFSGLPHGIAFYDGYLYVAEERRISRYPYLNNGDVGQQEVIVENLPARAGHVSRTIGFNSAGKMYVSVGSSCNVCEEQDDRRAAILEFDTDGSNGRVFAIGVRNAVGLVTHPVTEEIWATENGRDLLGDDLPPDEINIVQGGKHYGWPYCYGKKISDPAHSDARDCATTEPSVHNIQAHSAPLGLRFIQGPQFPEEWQGDLLVAYHGSWNRSEPTGYKVVRLDVEGDEVVGEEYLVAGWLKRDGPVVGRPVDLIFDSTSALYISDDRAGVIYRVTKSQD